MIARNELIEYLLDKDKRESVTRGGSSSQVILILKESINSNFDVLTKLENVDAQRVCQKIRLLCLAHFRDRLDLTKHIKPHLSIYLQLSLMYPKISWDNGRTTQSLIQYVYEFLSTGGESHRAQISNMLHEIKENFSDYFYFACLVSEKFSDLNAAQDLCEFVLATKLFSDRKLVSINANKLLPMLYFSHNTILVEYLVDFFNKQVGLELVNCDHNVFTYMVQYGIDNSRKLDVGLLNKLLILIYEGHGSKQAEEWTTLNDFLPLIKEMLKDNVVVHGLYDVFFRKLSIFKPRQKECQKIIDFFDEEKEKKMQIKDVSVGLFELTKLNNFIDGFCRHFTGFGYEYAKRDQDSVYSESKYPLIISYYKGGYPAGVQDVQISGASVRLK